MKVTYRSILTFSSFVGVLILYIILSINIRPIADDYCAAAGSSNGVFSYMQNLTQTWSGDYLQILFNGLLVAFPLTTAPLFLLGIFTLFLFICLFLILMFLLLNKLHLSPHSWRSSVSVALLFLITWNLYWALPATISLQSEYDRLLDAKESFSGVFGWPTVIVQYLVVPLFIVLISFVRVQNAKLKYSLMILIGLMIGTGGYALALAVTVASCLLFITSDKSLGFIKTILLNVGICSGVVLSFLSPGAQARSELLATSRNNSYSDSILRWFGVSSLEFVAAIFNLGVFVALLLGLLLSLHLDRFFWVEKLKFKDKSILESFGVFLLVYYASISVSEYLTYNAFWHLITFRAGLFFFVLYLGIFLGHKLKTRFQGFLFPRFAPFAFVLSIFVLVSQTNYDLVERRIDWSQGSAPLPGISDISPEGGWVDKCWDEISSQSKYPERG